MTWNVWWRFGPRWQDRQAGLLQTIRDVDPDVVALQESWATASSTQAGEFAEALGLHHAFAAQSLPPLPDVPEHPDQAEVDLGVGLLSRWPITATRPVPLPVRHRPQAPAPPAGAGPARRAPRASRRPAARRRDLPGVGARLQRRPHRPGPGGGRSR